MPIQQYIPPMMQYIPQYQQLQLPSLLPQYSIPQQIQSIPSNINQPSINNQQSSLVQQQSNQQPNSSFSLETELAQTMDRLKYLTQKLNNQKANDNDKLQVQNDTVVQSVDKQVDHQNDRNTNTNANTNSNTNSNGNSDEKKQQMEFEPPKIDKLYKPKESELGFMNFLQTEQKTVERREWLQNMLEKVEIFKQINK